MIKVITFFFIARYAFLCFPYWVSFLIVGLGLLISCKIPKFLNFVFLFLLEISLLQTCLFPISSFLQNTFPYIHFPSGMSEIVLCAIYALLSNFLVAQKNITKKHYKVFFILVFIVQCYFVDTLAYSFFILDVVLVLIIIGTRLLITVPEINFSQSKKISILCFASLILLFVGQHLMDRYDNSLTKTIYISDNIGVWATNQEKFTDKDWSLKSAYSYSLLDDLLSKKYRVIHKKNLDDLISSQASIVFFMTPTRPFTIKDKNNLNQFLDKGGHVVFIADHTDLYGHARAINDITSIYGITLKYDAVFKPNNKHATVLLPEYLNAQPRLMTGCGMLVNFGVSVRSFFRDFISENADYTRPNFFAEMLWTPNDYVGLFPFLATVKAKNGYITVCTDSTIFSNFSIFHPRVLTLLDATLKPFPGINFFPFLLVICSLVFSVFNKNCVRTISVLCFFTSLLLFSRIYILLNDTAINYYEDNKVLYVDSPASLIYEPYFDNVGQAQKTCSFLMSSIARYGVYPYYLDWFEKKFLMHTDLSISLEKNLFENTDGPIVFSQSNAEKINSADNLSDKELGDWWIQLDTSPFRKNRVFSFINWLKNKELIPTFCYPDPVLGSSTSAFSILLHNDKGEVKKVYLDQIKKDMLVDDKYIYLGKKVWGIIAKLKGDYIMVGGDSFNDDRSIPFFNRYWYATLPKELIGYR